MTYVVGQQKKDGVTRPSLVGMARSKLWNPRFALVPLRMQKQTIYHPGSDNKTHEDIANGVIVERLHKKVRLNHGVSSC